MAGSFFTNVAVNLVSKLGECLFDPIGRHFGYVLCYKSHVEDLKNEVKELESARERVQHSIDEARNDAKPIYTDVEDWLGSVTKEVEEAQNLLECGKSAKSACFRGWIPNPVVRHPIGRKVKETTEVIKGLLEKSRNSNFKKAYYENTPPGIVAATTSATRSVDKEEDPLESRASIIDDVMKAIADDKIHVIGVYGPGGVGKSKLLEDIEKRVKQEKLFDVVVVANVSRNPDLKIIQGEIADALGLKLMNVETTRGRANRLHERLVRDHDKNILIILDNLWKKLELKDVGIPCADDNKVRGCKLLLSSRLRSVLRIDMGIDQEFRLNELNQDEARRLFERIVGDKVNDLDSKPLVDGVVKNCGGLPLLILSVAKRLKHGDLAEWSNALTNLELSDAKSIVELNYDDLKDERIKSLFLVSALSIKAIMARWTLVYCMGLGLYKKFKTIKDARDRLIMDLHSLQDSSLLLDSDGMEDFKMHDIFVDVAISITSTQWNALVGREDYGFKEWSRDELRKCTAMSFSFVGIDELPERLDCPNLRMLLLFENDPSLKIPESFFKSTKKLQVLDFTSLSFPSLPSSIEYLEDLKSLCLDDCHLQDVTLLGKLKGLQFLSFQRSTITRLPKEIGELIELRFLNLASCTELKIIEPGVLGRLVNLEELYMEDSFDQWEAKDEVPQNNASLTELKNMKKLSTLFIDIPHFAHLPRDLPFGKLHKHQIRIGGIWDWSSKNTESRILKLKLNSSNFLLEEWVSKCLQKTQDLHLDGLQDGINSIHDLCDKGFQELKHLHIQNSPSFQYVVRSIENLPSTAFTRLESLFLKNMINLDKICCGCLSLKSFSKLKIVKVDDCGEIKHLFPLSMKRIISQLEEVEISKCHLMQQILTDVKADEDGDEIDDDTKVKSCNLRRLILQDLPKMTNFYKTVDHSVGFFHGKQLIKLQNLETITIERCQLIQEVFDLEGLTASGKVKTLPQLKELTLSDLPSLICLWNKNPQRTLSLQNLRALKVRNCESLRFLFSCAMAIVLRQIKEIEVASCKLMEEIMGMQEEELEEAATSDIIEFPLLTSLSLEELPNLMTFHSGKYRIRCPSLTSLRISECPKMKTFSSFEGKQQLIIADTGLQQVFGCINSGLPLPVFFNEKVLFPSLEELQLSSLRKLKTIWHNKLHGQSFYKLTSLTIDLCENLLHVFPSNSIDWLQSLNKIKVVGCPSLEELFEPVSLNAGTRQKPLVLSALKKVKLLNLPKMTDIFKSNYKVTWAFPSLMKVSVRRCHSLPYLFSAATAKTLDKLEVLDVSCCNNLRSIFVMEEGKGKIIETLKFRHLSTLKLGDLENLISFSSASCAGDGLHPLFDEKLAFPKLEELQIKGIQLKELWHDKILAESFCRLKALEVKHCHNLLNVIPAFMWMRLLYYMESLTVESCNLIEGIQTLEGLNIVEIEAARNSSLRKLSLRDLPNLTCIWKNEDLLNLCFHNLTSVRVEKCPRLRNLFTVSMAKSLGQLQHLVLGGCGEIEYVIAGEEEKPEEVVHRNVIPKLVTLYLQNMPKLKSFCHEKHILEWPLLKEFIVENCQAVEVIIGGANSKKPEGSIPTQQPLLLVEKVGFISMELMKISHMDNVEKIWLDDLASNAFSKLKTLIVEYCEKLSSIFSSGTILTRFRNLEELTVTGCNSLQVVFQVQELNMSGSQSTNPHKLRKLELEGLPKMKYVWSGLPQGGLTFGHLHCVLARKCQSLKSLFPASVAKGMTQLEELAVRFCGVEEIIADEEEGVGMSADDLFLPQLTRLTLVELPELRRFYKNNHASQWPLLKKFDVRHCSKMRFFSFACEIQNCQGTITSEGQPALFSVEKVIPRLAILALAREDVVMMRHSYIFDNLGVLLLQCYHDENPVFPSNFLMLRFPSLEHFIVQCSSFEDIFTEDAFDHGGATPCGRLTDMGKTLTTLGNLKQLWLSYLYDLRRLWRDGSLMAEILKQIEFLYILGCPSLSILFPSPISFDKLTKLQVEYCSGLVHMGTCSAVARLVQLTQLILRDCHIMEDVVLDDGNGAKISFPNLEELILDGLPSLESFSPTNCAFMFRSLVRIVVRGCPKMKTFCKGALRTPKLDKLLLSEEDDEWHWEGDLNTTIQTLLT